MFSILHEIFLNTTPIGYISLPSDTPTMLLAPLIKINLATFLKTPEISLPGGSGHSLQNLSHGNC